MSKCKLEKHYVFAANKKGTPGFYAACVDESDFKQQGYNFKRRHKRRGDTIVRVLCDEAVEGMGEYLDFEQAKK